MNDERFLALSKADLFQILRISDSLQQRMSDLLIEQLRAGLVTNWIHPEKVMDEIYAADRGTTTRTGAADQFKHPPLKGFWKKHFFQTSFMGRNLMNEWKMENPRSGKFDNLHRTLNKTTKDPLQLSAMLAHNFVMDGFEKRSREGRLDGEWIIFAKHEGQNYYLTIAFHNEGDEVIFERISSMCAVQFPFLYASHVDKEIENG